MDKEEKRMTGHDIKELRLSLGWSQMKMATEVRCHLSTIQKLEGKGETGKPSLLLEMAINALVAKIEGS